MPFWTKRRKSAAAAVLVLLIVFIAFLPQILSTTVGKRFFIHTVEAKTGAEVKVGYLHLSWLGPQKASSLVLTGSEYFGAIESMQADIPLWKFSGLFEPENLLKLKGNFSLQGGDFEFHSAGVPEASVEGVNISFRMHEGSADFTAAGKTLQGNEAGSFSLQGQIGRLLEAVPDFSFRGEVTAFPTLALARFLAHHQKIDQDAVVEIIGSSFSLNGSASLQNEKGSCDLSFHAPNGDAEISGNLNEKVFTLRDALRVTIRLTKALAEKILTGMNPLFLTGIEAKKPIQLRVETSQFRLFLGQPFHWSSLQVGKATLDMGKIRCTNGSTLGALIGMLKKSPLSRTKEMEVWFTPLFFKLENGILETGRMDALAAGSVHFCTWGNINLVKDKIDMTLGLTGDTLRSAFGLKQISDTYVLKIPISGSTRDPKLAVAAGAAKIAALIAAQHAPKGAGGLLNIFLQPESDVPPANRPFPWEG